MQTKENKAISHNELKKKIEDSSDLMLVDVRSKDEHLSGTIKDSVCIPHDEILENLDKLPKDKELVVFCRSGNRSDKACKALAEKGYTNIRELSGGIASWDKEGMPIYKVRKTTISIQRQVMIAAGTLISLGAFLGHFIDYKFWALSAFVGIGLLLAGLTGYCGMALLLERMPWNKTQ